MWKCLFILFVAYAESETPLLPFNSYPCGLWSLFHTLTVSADLNDMPPSAILYVVRDYVRVFFQCRVCAGHFIAMAESIDEDMKQAKKVAMSDTCVSHERCSKLFLSFFQHAHLHIHRGTQFCGYGGPTIEPTSAFGNY